MRVVAHIDIDCFFVQAELLDNPTLLGKPVAVYQHDDILSVSYEAQELGIRRHDVPKEVNQKYPSVSLLSVPIEKGTTKVSYEKYLRLSRQVFAIIHDHIPQATVEKSGMDEAFLDLSAHVSSNIPNIPVDQLIYGSTDNIILTSSEEQLVDAGKICQILRDDIKSKTGLVISIGIGINKLIAKIASARFKPNCQTIVLPRFHQKLMEEVLLTRLPHYKSKCAPIRELLENELKLVTVRDLLERFPEVVERTTNQNCVEWLRDVCEGNDSAPVTQTKPPKSLSVSMTLTPISHGNMPQIRRIFEYLIINLESRLLLDEEEYERKATAICVRFRFVDQKEMKTQSFVLPHCIQNEQFIMKLLEQVITLGKQYQPWQLRWCGLFCSKFISVPKNCISNYFTTSQVEKKQPVQVSALYPNQHATKTIRKQSPKKKPAPVQPSMLNFFTKQANK